MAVPKKTRCRNGGQTEHTNTTQVMLTISAITVILFVHNFSDHKQLLPGLGRRGTLGPPLGEGGTEPLQKSQPAHCTSATKQQPSWMFYIQPPKKYQAWLPQYSDVRRCSDSPPLGTEASESMGFDAIAARGISPHVLKALSRDNNKSTVCRDHSVSILATWGYCWVEKLLNKIAKCPERLRTRAFANRD